jgi:hypothetical protein
VLAGIGPLNLEGSNTMPTKNTATDRVLDPLRLVVAAHELGHALTWAAAGMPIVKIWVDGYGEQAHGYVRLDRKKLKDAAEARDYLVGMLAGRAADIRWCDEHGLTHHEYTCADDLASFRKSRKHPWVRDIPDSEFYTAARIVVRQHWPQICRLAPRLSRHGSIQL